MKNKTTNKVNGSGLPITFTTTNSTAGGMKFTPSEPKKTKKPTKEEIVEALSERVMGNSMCKSCGHQKGYITNLCGWCDYDIDIPVLRKVEETSISFQGDTWTWGKKEKPPLFQALFILIILLGVIGYAVMK